MTTAPLAFSPEVQAAGGADDHVDDDGDGDQQHQPGPLDLLELEVEAKHGGQDDGRGPGTGVEPGLEAETVADEEAPT